MEGWKPSWRQITSAAEIARGISLPLDRLPYTREFDAAHERLAQAVGPLSRSQSWQCFLSARKRGLTCARYRRVES